MMPLGGLAEDEQGDVYFFMQKKLDDNFDVRAKGPKSISPMNDWSLLSQSCTHSVP